VVEDNHYLFTLYSRSIYISLSAQEVRKVTFIVYIDNAVVLQSYLHYITLHLSVLRCMCELTDTLQFAFLCFIDVGCFFPPLLYAVIHF